MVEGIHGEAKTQHGLRRAVRRGLSNVAIQVYLTAAVINLKRLATFKTQISLLLRAIFTTTWQMLEKIFVGKRFFQMKGIVKTVLVN